MPNNEAQLRAYNALKMIDYKFIGKTKTEVFIDPALLKKDALMN